VVSLYQEFLLFLLPIINTRSLRRRVVRAVSTFKWVDMLPPQIRPQGASNNPDTLSKRGRYYLLPANECAICAEDASMDLSLLRDSKGPVQNPSISDQSGNTETPSWVTPTYPINNPYKTSCGHVYCYVCISDRILRAADEGEKYWECLRCDEKITHASRHNSADVRPGRSAGSGDSAHVRRRWGSIVSSSLSRLGGGGYGTSELDDSELSALDLDSISSMERRTHSGSDDLSE
jgi:peroxin-2